MKKIGVNLWEKYYNTEPNTLQKAFIQRWFELLDSNTNFIDALPQISLKGICEEMLNIGLPAKELRTIHFLLLEASLRIKSLSLLNNPHAESVGHFIHATDRMYLLSQRLYSAIGEKKNTQDSNHKDIFISEFTNYTQVYNKSFMDAELDDSKFLYWQTRYIYDLLEVPPSINSQLIDVQRFGTIDTLAKEIIVFLIERRGFSKSYLKDLAKKNFFSHKRTDFLSCLLELFHSCTKEHQSFVFYFKIQKRPDLIPVDKFRGVIFIQNLSDELEYLQQSLMGKVSDLQFSKLKYFLHHGEYPNDKTIVKVEVGSSVDVRAALKLADEEIVRVLNAFKFEYSARNITVDNKVLVINTKVEDAQVLRRKSITKQNIHNVGTPSTLKKVVGDIASNSLLEVKETALYWYKQALETPSSSASFLNLWICLEQIFKLSEESQPRSSADKLVRVIGNRIKSKQKDIEALNFFGDMYRVGVLAPRRLKINGKGRILFSETVFKNKKESNLYVLNDFDYIFIEGNKNRKRIRIPEGSILLVGDGNLIESNIWISGKYLDTQTITENDFFRIAFAGREIETTNVFYLIYYSLYVSIPFVPKEYSQLLNDYQGRIGELIFKLENQTYNDFLDSYPKIGDVINEVTAQFKKNWSNLPDDIILELCRGMVSVDTLPAKECIINGIDEHPLLKYNFIRSPLIDDTYSVREDWHAKLDRVRRVRNELTHEAKTGYNIELLSEFISKISRFYLRELFRESAIYSNKTNNDIIHFK